MSLNHLLTSQVDTKTYQDFYQQSIKDSQAFWRTQGKRLDWIKPYTEVSDCNFDANDFRIRWFNDGTLNVAANCIDRHLSDKANQTAIFWEADEVDGEHRALSYQDLYHEVGKTALGLQSIGVEKGDRVVIYMPMVPEAAIIMLACARIGAIHSVVFAGFSPDSLAGRIKDCGAKVLVTADEAPRGGRVTPLKVNADEALSKVANLDANFKTIVFKGTGGQIPWNANRDIDWADFQHAQQADYPLAEVKAEDPLFILYTSGSTGTPKGLVHSSGGYLCYASLTQQVVFGCDAGDVFYCTADVGWITGHSYQVYGPLANASSMVMFEGVPTYPNASRFWQICEKYKVKQFYTAPTAIRSLMGLGTKPVEGYDLSSLEVLGSVGEPINPQAWQWFSDVIGKGKLPIVDTYWQTETGGHLITPLPQAHRQKPGSASQPFFGIEPALLTKDAELIEGEGAGMLAIAQSWPGQARTIWNNHERFIDTYFSTLPGYYFTGDGARRDEEGDYWITGRMDDVINVAGHRMGTAEIESALVAHADVCEAAVVGTPHPVKGQAIYAYVSLNQGIEASGDLNAELRNWVGEQIGPIAKPQAIQFAPGLPKTRSGKIMRRILRKIADGEIDQLGDTSTLAEPAVVDDLIQNRIDLHQ